ncbi:PF20097 family protein [Mucisphaera sp.]|uniref:PF20097 family protein n=1 Tax=Mucisphaera sp. TaxID=2913024 RepID=UPI003D0B3B17
MATPAQPETFRCPRCRARMTPGVLPIAAGLSWLPLSPNATPAMAEGLPGTHAIMRPNRLPAWRCRACELVLFRHGRKMTDPLAEPDELPPEEIEPLDPRRDK